MPRAACYILIALLVVLAGCAGFGGQPPTESTTTTTTQTTTTETPATTTTTQTTTMARTATTTTVPESSVVAYEALSSTEQRFFRELLGNDTDSQVAPPPFGLRNLSGGEYVSLSSKGSVYVRYRGTLYEVSYRSIGFYGRYTPEVWAVNRTVTGQPVRAYENLSTRAQSVFRAGLAGEAPEHGYANEEFPRELLGYVRYNGTLYRVVEVHADYVRAIYSAQKVRER